MGGIGKTTLAMNLFENALVKERFNIRAWTTISQTYNVRQILREVLFRASGDSSSDLSENELGQKLYQFLFGRRYLIIMDDMWSIEAWEKIKNFFPDNQNRSRIIVTTRLSDLSSQLNESCIIGMKFLDEASSWDLFCKTVFGKESCPIELEKIGKNVVANCKGLPLSIATIGGLLSETASEDEKVLLSCDLRLLRTFRACDYDSYFLENVFELVNSRYLAIRVHRESRFSTSIDLLWNLQTLIIYSSFRNDLHVPNAIWKLHQLRHLEFLENEFILPNPPSDDSDIVIMENLQALKGVDDMLLNEKVAKRIPNVKKLHLTYTSRQKEGENCLRYLQCFSKLENLYCCTFYQSGDFLRRINFPNSIKKLIFHDLYSTEFGAKLEDILPKIGSLPLLEKFVLRNCVFRTGMWETIEVQFQNLKFPKLWCCRGLVNWIVSDSSHFPLLEKLRLYRLSELEEIPSEVGEIATLKSISLLYKCSEAAVASAKKIVEEHEDLYGEKLDLRVNLR